MSTILLFVVVFNNETILKNKFLKEAELFLRSREAAFYLQSGKRGKIVKIQNIQYIITYALFKNHVHHARQWLFQLFLVNLLRDMVTQFRDLVVKFGDELANFGVGVAIYAWS